MMLDVQNAVDIARWAKEQFKQPLFLIGGSLGGPMSYYAAAAGAPAEAIACLNLYDWSPGSPDVAEIFGSTAAAAARSAGALVGALGWLRLPWKKLATEAWANILDERDVQGKLMWSQDTLMLSYVTIAFVHALTSTAPAVPFEHNEVPVLVISQDIATAADDWFRKHLPKS